jgi:hypothetical protein
VDFDDVHHPARFDLNEDSRGVRIVVRDRDDPIAQLGPPVPEALSWRDRLGREGLLRLGSQDWARLKISSPESRVDIQSALAAVREESDEIRRR